MSIYNSPIYFQNNPCYNESQASLKCQISNPGDTDACQRFVDNYKLCLDFWKNVRIARRAKNLSPGKYSIKSYVNFKSESNFINIL